MQLQLVALAPEEATMLESELAACNVLHVLMSTQVHHMSLIVLSVSAATSLRCMQAISGKNVVSTDDVDQMSASRLETDGSHAAYYGAILADDMGLGKTLQVLAVSWALMNAQGPTGRPFVRKMLIVAPSSVCSNWGKEIKKWIGAFHGECHRVLMPGKHAANTVSCDHLSFNPVMSLFLRQIRAMQ
jgi:hypothetical protein